MHPDEATLTYVIPEPVGVALKNIRQALANGNLRIVDEMDLPRIIGQMLGIALPSVRILLVWCSSAPPAQTDDENPFVSAFFPMHVVVEGHGRHTEVHIAGGLPYPIAGPANKIQARLRQALDTIAMRRPVCSLA